MALQRTSVISGRILDEVGEPASGATVSAMQVMYLQGRRTLASAAGPARSDDTGQYRVVGLAPGEYVVMASLRETWPADDDPKMMLGVRPVLSSTHA